jgi:2-(1,2-epoxy-1,2-dihydrophenyl)acetyl-CoA isomerase
VTDPGSSAAGDRIAPTRGPRNGSVTLSVEGGVARLTLARPEAGNALDPALARALRDAASSLDDRVRVVVLRAEGRAFCVGGDLAFMRDCGDEVTAGVYGLASDFHAALEALARLDAPVITAVQGVAAGGGMSMAIAGDLVVAAESAWFTMAYTAAGLSPDGGSTWTLPRLVGVRRATELMLLNERLSAAQALELGLVSRVVPDAELEAAVDDLASRLAAGPTGAYGEVKRLLRASWAASFEDQLAAETDAISSRAGSPDGREGIGAFLEKRAPRFS